MVDPITGAILFEQINEINAEMVGLSVAEAWRQQNFEDPVSAGFGVDFGIKRETSGEDKPAISGDTNNSIINGSSDDSLESFEDYAEDNPSAINSTTGGVVEGSKVDTFVYSLMESGPVGERVVKAVVPVAIPVQQAYVAISQALGVSMDVAEMDMETKQYVYDAVVSGNNLVFDQAKGLVKAWWDGVNILFPRKTVQAVSDALVDIGITGPDSTAEDQRLLPGVEIHFSNAASFSGMAYADTYSATVTGGSCCVFLSGSVPALLAASPNRGQAVIFTSIRNGVRTDRTGYLNSSYTYDGRTVYWGYDVNSVLTEWSTSPEIVNSDNMTAIAWIMVYGHITPGGEYPVGTAESSAPKYTPQEIPTAGDIAQSPTDTMPVVPIYLPPNPGDTIDTRDDPVLTPTDEDEVETLPPLPIPSPAPNTGTSNPDVPLSDPTTINPDIIDSLIDQLAETLDPLPPQPSGIIPPPPLPGIVDPTTGESSYPSIVPASGPGLVHVYNPTPAEFVSFGQWLWVTYADATIDKIWSNPFDGIIGAFELYATPETSGSDNIRSGFLTCPTTAALVRQRYIEINCGSIIVPEFYGNYLDYSPYSQAYIYLPFIGINEVSVDDIVGHAINIRYRIDTYTGSCIAMIYVAKKNYRNLCYQFAGNCAVEVPLAGGSQAAIKAGVMQAEAYARSSMWSTLGSGVSNALTGLGTGGLAGLGFGLIGALGSAVGNYANAQAGMQSARVANKASVQHSGQFGASHGAMGEKVPFIMIRNPIQVKVVNYNDEYGFPAHKRVIIGGCTGFLRCQEVHVISAHATDKEKAAIESMLKSGVYVT